MELAQSLEILTAVFQIVDMYLAISLFTARGAYFQGVEGHLLCLNYFDNGLKWLENEWAVMEEAVELFPN